MSAPFAISGAPIFDGDTWHQGRALVVDAGKIAAIAVHDDIPHDLDIHEVDAGMIVPGFVDLQVNGGGGVLFNGDRSVEGLTKLCAAHFPFGTTALLPTLITDTPDVTRSALEAGVAAQKAGVPGFAGLHIEGPHLSIARKGAHNPEYIRSMTDADFDTLLTARKGLATLLTTVAVETVPPARIADLVRAGIIVSLGHSDAGAKAARAAFDAGATMVTHLFNAMSPLENREPGLVGAALTSGVWAGLIADGLHVDPATIQIALRAKQGPGKIFLVTDAMSTIGTDLKSFTLNGREIIREDGALRLADGTLAGADLTMIDAVRYAHRDLGLPLEEALRMASAYPARAIGREAELGHLRAGAKACLVHLDDKLGVHGVWIEGKKVFG